MRLQEEEVVRIIEQLKQKRVGYVADDIERYFNELGIEITRDSWKKILERLVDEENIFLWFQFICRKLPYIAEATPSFITLISKIIRKVKKDMASGFLTTALVDIGMKDLELGLKLFEISDSSDDEDLKLWAGLFLGGVGRIRPDLVFKKIESQYQSSPDSIKASFIWAVRAMRKGTERIEVPARILEILEAASNDNNVRIRTEAIAAYMALYELFPKEFGERLLQLAEKGTSEDRFVIARNFWAHDLPNKHLEFQILEACSEDLSIPVLDSTAFALFRRASENPERILEIIRAWIKKGVYYKIYEASHITDGLQESDLEKCFSIIESWVEKDADKLLEIEISRILCNIFLKNSVNLLSLLQNWKDKDVRFVKVILTTIREMLSRVYSKEIGDNVVNPSLSLLTYLAVKKEVDVNRIIRAEPDKLFQAFILIEELETQRPELDYDAINYNLDDYSAIKDFVGASWFQEMEKKKNKSHPLLIFLSRAKPDNKELEERINEFKSERDELRRIFLFEMVRNMLYAPIFLSHLNEMLNQFHPTEQGTAHIRNGISQEEQFWQTVSELEIATSFKAKYPTVIEPKIGTKHLDVQITLNNKIILIEVTNPEMFKPLRYVTTVIGMKDRAKKKIADKIEEQLKYLISIVNNPLVLVIDISRSEIDYEGIESSLAGSLALRLIFDKVTGKSVGEYVTRAQDSLLLEKPEAKIISAVVAFKRHIGNDGAMHLEGKIFKNTDALHPLDDSVIELLGKEIFR